jgi:hypothetical protein
MRPRRWVVSAGVHVRSRPAARRGRVPVRDHAGRSHTADRRSSTTDEPATEGSHDDGNPNAEAARYLTRLRETGAQGDSIAGRLTGYQRKEAERIASAGVSKASDLWLDSADIAELLDDEVRSTRTR